MVRAGGFARLLVPDCVAMKLPSFLSRRESRLLFGVVLSTESEAAIVARLLGDRAPGSGLLLVATLNLDHVVRLRTDPVFRESYRRAALVTADGTPVYLYARLLGIALPQRVTGIDLTRALLERLDPARHRPFFVASTPEIARRAEASLIGRGFAADSVAWASPPHGFETDPAACDALSAAVRRHRATHLFVGIGARQGKAWLNRDGARLGDCCALCVGAALEVQFGARRRAPAWLRRLGLEWLWRVAQEPRRLARRYFVSSWSFVPAVFADLVTRGAKAKLRG
jgi:N-acetylglucosaminyldiphosphoundecaprenol N-acetyl-beta-D-mannosaminyltransferase